MLLEKYQQASTAAAAATQAGSDPQTQQQPGMMAAAAAAAAGGDGSNGSSGKQGMVGGMPMNAVRSGPPLLLDEAVAVIIRNERGRQVRVVGSWSGVSADLSCLHPRFWHVLTQQC